MAASLRSIAPPAFSLGLWRARSGSGPWVVFDTRKAPDEGSHRRVECLDDPSGHGYGLVQDLFEGHGAPFTCRCTRRDSGPATHHTKIAEHTPWMVEEHHLTGIIEALL